MGIAFGGAGREFHGKGARFSVGIVMLFCTIAWYIHQEKGQLLIPWAGNFRRVSAVQCQFIEGLVVSAFKRFEKPFLILIFLSLENVLGEVYEKVTMSLTLQIACDTLLD